MKKTEITKISGILNRMADEADALTVCGVRNCHLVSLIAGNIQLLREFIDGCEDESEDDNGEDKNTDD